MFGIDDMALATGVSALANLGGGMLSSAGAASNNAAMMDQQRIMNQQTLNAQMAAHAQNTAFMEDQQSFAREERQFAERFSGHQAELARGFNWRSMEAQNAFQQAMASTQYQRAMADMRAAGLNPILAYQRGGNASPAGGSASSPSPSSSGASGSMASALGGPSLGVARTENTQAEIGRAVGNIANTALEVMKTVAGIDSIRQAITESQARTDKTREETATEPVRRAQIALETLKTGHEIENTKANLKYIQAQTDATLTSAGLTAEQIRVMRQFDSTTAPSSIERVLRDWGLGMPDKKSPVILNGKPLQLPEEADWIKWIKRQFQ